VKQMYTYMLEKDTCFGIVSSYERMFFFRISGDNVDVSDSVPLVDLVKTLVAFVSLPLGLLLNLLCGVL